MGRSMYVGAFVSAKSSEMREWLLAKSPDHTFRLELETIRLTRRFCLTTP